MVKLIKNIDEIQVKKAEQILIPKEKPYISGEPGLETIFYSSGVTIPGSLNGRLLDRCNVGVKKKGDVLSRDEVRNIILEKNEEKNLYVRLANGKPLSVVTDKFEEISPFEISDVTSKIMGVSPEVRYFKNDESLQFNYPILGRFKGLNLVVNTGSYGVYGGSGKNAVTYGISWFNDVCTNWTLFLDKTIRDSFGKVIHKDIDNIEDKIFDLVAMAENVGNSIEESKDCYFDKVELNKYFEMYNKKGLPKGITSQLVEENPKGMSCFDLSYRLTELCQNDKLSDTTRSKVEYLGGEVMLCYPKIKEKIWGNKKVVVPKRHSYKMQSSMSLSDYSAARKRNYVRM